MKFFAIAAVVATNISVIIAATVPLEKRGQANPVIGLTDAWNGRYRPARQELNDFIKNGDQLNLYLIGLDALQHLSYGNPLSWFSLATIHGRPFQAWNGEQPTGNTQHGYCEHNSILFPTWHRPYLALYEQTLSNKIKQLANTFPANQRQRWVNAANGFRIPYWDWAINNSQMPAILGSQTTVTITRPDGKQYTILNPLYTYKFNQGISNQIFPWQPYMSWPTTLRNANSNDVNAQSQPAVTNQKLANQYGNLKQLVYHLLVDTTYQDYKTMSNMATGSSAAGNSIEGIHNIIHSLTGGNGHMTVIDASAFDPIFFLHHANVDRIFALWQALNPNSYVTSQVNSDGTYGIPAGTNEDINTGLSPFRRTDGTFWTSATSRDTSTFGYAYPETGYWRYGSTSSYQSAVRGRINALYGQTNAALAASSVSSHKRDLISDITNIVQDVKTDVGDIINDVVNATAALASSVTDHIYYDWKTTVQVNSMALNGSFQVHVFIGQPCSDPQNWELQPELVGDYSVLTGYMSSSMNPAGTLISGSVPLTQDLMNHITAGNLSSLNPQDVQPFLLKNLQWRISSSDGTAYPVESVSSLNVGVYTAQVRLPGTALLGNAFPQYGTYQLVPDITCNKTGGAQ